MRVIQLSATNVKKLTAVEIRPVGSVVTIGGKNGAGKSSVLDAIAYAMGGSRQMPEAPVRRGADKAKIVIDLGDYLVTRTVTPTGGGTLTVTGRDGLKVTSPQALLDSLIGSIAFDPMGFVAMPPAKQREMLLRVVQVDVDAFERRKTEKLLERSDLTKQLAAEKIRVDAVRVPESGGFPDTPLDSVELAARLEHAAETEHAAREAARAQAEAKGAEDRARQSLADWERRAADLRDELAQTEARLFQIRDALPGVIAHHAAMAAVAVDAAGHVIDRAPILEAIGKIGSHNTLVNQGRAVRIAQREVGRLTELIGHVGDQIAALDAEKREALAAATFPVKGMGFAAAGVTLNGLPFEQASTAEQIRASVAMALSLQPTLRVMLVRDGSLLDAASLATLEQIAEEHDAQVWLERVTDDPGGAQIIIENGAVAEERA